MLRGMNQLTGREYNMASDIFTLGSEDNLFVGNPVEQTWDLLAQFIPENLQKEAAQDLIDLHDGDVEGWNLDSDLWIASGYSAVNVNSPTR